MTPVQIIIIVLVIVGLILLMRLIQPKLTPSEKYLLHIIQRKSPQSDNIRLFMWTKMVAHNIEDASDLEYQKEYLDNLEEYKMLIEQFYGFGPNVFYPLFGYEAIHWHLDDKEPDPLMIRLAASQIVRRFPHSAAVIEDLVVKSPDALTERYTQKHPQGLPEPKLMHDRYYYLIEESMKLIVNTTRNEWWPGVSPDIREWAENILARLEKKKQAANGSTTGFQS
jgi:hypothetical protein